MSSYCTKSKWNSQQIQKQFKNKHRNDFDVDWSLKSNHSIPFVRACNEYHKNIYTNYNNEDELFIDEEYDEYNPSYWRCNNCTYDNIERDSYCIICQSPFKSQTNSSQYVSNYITLADHLPSNIDTIIHVENDMDQLLQFAIMNSYNNINYKHSNSQTHIPIKSTPTKEQIRRNKIKKQKQQQQEKERQKKLKEFRKKQAQQRLIRLQKEKERKFIEKCVEKCPKLNTVIGENIVDFIRKNINEQYKNNKLFNIKFILNYNVLLKFVSEEKCNDLKFVYHGTDSKNNDGIITNGLIVGGTKGVRIRNGSCYGRGIYCSPWTATAKTYERGSMFICIVRDGKVQRNGTIWVVPKATDILPLYLVSFREKRNNLNCKPVFPYFPVSDTLKEFLKTKNNVVNVSMDDGLNQQIVRFIPSFCLLNNKEGMMRKIKRKWSAYYKINQY